MEVCQTMSVRSVFRLIMTIGVEKVTGGVTNPHRRYVGQIICRCLQSSESVKQEALHGQSWEMALYGYFGFWAGLSWDGWCRIAKWVGHD
ncbi:unnamed protein product [Anisakis simplex]|uniref:Secreted protein n=1 Tax=Anisakis simplex TaxID=6269 RepID=A0A0M3JDZ2_ANISI|nr:unnamed protein product [Anisakis simplex]